MAFTPAQNKYRWYEDGTEAGATAAAAEDTAITADVQAGNLDRLLRIRLQEGGGDNGASTDDYQLQYRKNAGTWTNVTGASSEIQAFASASLTDGGATTQRLTAGTGSFVAGEVSEDGLVDDLQLTGSNHTELLYGVRFVAADLTDADSIEFRVLLNGATITYSATPTATVDKVTYTLTAEAGSFTLTGTDVAFTYPYYDYNMTAEAGSFTLTGTDATLTLTRKLQAGSGSFVLTGSDIILPVVRSIAKQTRNRRGRRLFRDYNSPGEWVREN